MSRSMVLVGVLSVGACSGGARAPNDDAAGDATDSACAPFDVHLPTTDMDANPVWTGHEYLMLVGDATNGHQIVRIAADGTQAGGFATLPSTSAFLPTYQQLAWGGSQLGVLTYETAGLSLTRFDAMGTVLGTTVLATGRVDGLVAWANDRFVVTWIPEIGGSQLWLAEVTPDGTATLPTNPTYQAPATHPFSLEHALATSTTRYVETVTQTTANPAVIVVDRGTLQANGQLLSNINNFDLRDVVARDPEFATFTATSFQRIDASGSVTAPVDVNVEGFTSFVPTSSGYRVYAMRSFAVGTYDISATELDPLGAIVAGPRPVASVPNDPATTSISGPYALATPQRTAVYVVYGDPAGPHTYKFDTARLIQECM